MVSNKWITEQSKLFNFGDTAGVEKIEAYFEEIARKLFPERDWSAQPIQFRLSDEDTVDASIYAYAKPPVVVVSRGTLEFVANEDELAFVIGHELGHDSIKRNVGRTEEVTKAEEAGADIISTKKLVNVGYRPDAGIEFFRRLQRRIDIEGKQTVLGELHNAVFDPHPRNGNRIIAMELALSHTTIFERGKIEFGEPTPLAPVIKENLGNAKHQTFIEGWLPNDFASWTPERKLRHLAAGFDRSSTEQDAPVDLRLRQILDAVKEIKTDGTPEYRAAAEDFVLMGANRDPYNSEYRFDGIYRVVAQTFKNDDKAHGYIAMGPFRKLGDELKTFSALTPDQTDELTRSARAISAELNNLGSYYNEMSSDDRMGAFNDFGSTRKRITPRSSVIRSTEINEYSRQPKLATLYPLAKNPAAAAAIWQLGGGYDEKLWEIIGPDQVQRLMAIQPVAGNSMHGFHTRDMRVRSYTELRTKAEAWVRQKTKPLVFKAPETISEYVAQYRDELFPMKGMGVSNILAGIHPEAEKFKVFVASKFAEAKTDEQRQRLSSELDSFYNESSRWLSELGRQSYFKMEDYVFKYASDALKKARSAKDVLGFMSMSSMDNDRTNPIPLPENHPYIQLLLAENAPFDASFKIRQVERVSHPDQISQETARKLYGFSPLKTIEECVELYDAMASQNKYGNSNFRSTFTRREAERIIKAKSSISLNDPDLLALARIAPDIPAYRYVAESLINKDVRDALAERLWVRNPASGFAPSLQAASLQDTIALYRFLDRNRLFPTTVERSALGDIVLQKIKQAEPEEKLAACERLLMRTPAEQSYSEPDSYVTANLSLRDEVLKVWQAELINHYGLDDGQSGYHTRAGKKIEQVLALSAARDRDTILETLADGLVIQTGLAAKIRNSLKPTSDTLRKSHLPIAGAEALFYEMERDEKLRLGFIDFLSEPLTKKSLAVASSVLKSNKHAVKELAGVEGIIRHDEHLILTPLQEQRLESNLQDLHDHFGYLSIEQRSALLSAMLVPGEHRLEEQKYTESYDKALTLVMDKLFPERSENAADSRSFMTAYLKTAADHERMALLAGMLAVSVDRDPNVSSSTAKQATKIMAALGPAYVKLGQAINSHPQCPDDWREATSDLKSAAKTDPRWVLIKQLEDRVPDSFRDTIVSFGPVLGSASFNTAMQLSLLQDNEPMEAVALIERPCAATRAEGGFEHLERAVGQWKSPVAQNHGDTLLEMLGEGRTMAKAETSLEVGEAQYARAKENYGARQVTVNGNGHTVININPVDSLAATQGIRIVSLASGSHFSDLPEATAAEKALKHTIAKAYVALEMQNILSGQAFDCDRHGKQLKVNVQADNTVDLNLYDFGGMAVTPPTEGQKQALGQVLNAVASGIIQGKKPESIIASAIARTTDIEDRQYLMRTRKAWLALSDFMRYLDGKQDYVDILKSVVATGIDPTIKKNMPVLSMLGFASGQDEIVIGQQPVVEKRKAASLNLGDARPPADDDAPPPRSTDGSAGKGRTNWWPWSKGRKLVYG